MTTLIDFMGGASDFSSRLDFIFQPNSSQQNLGANGLGITTIMNIGNEPDFATPYLYNYINTQYKSVMQTRDLANTFFHNEDYGVPGNSDAGALNSVSKCVLSPPVLILPIELPEKRFIFSALEFEETHL
jgi:putative alpha-1,2-mannosidase